MDATSLEERIKNDKSNFRKMTQEKEVFIQIKEQIINIRFIGYIPKPIGIYLHLILKNETELTFYYVNRELADQAYSDLLMVCERAAKIVKI